MKTVTISVPDDLPWPDKVPIMRISDVRKYGRERVLFTFLESAFKFELGRSNPCLTLVWKIIGETIRSRTSGKVSSPAIYVRDSKVQDKDIVSLYNDAMHRVGYDP